MAESKLDPHEYSYKKDYLEDWDVHRKYITSFDPYEAMLIGQVYDSVSNSVDGSKITDSYTATLAIERSARVMGKLPDGVTEPMAKADQGKAALMDILRQKWIYPNANAQHSFETKLRLWQLYSSVYGYMPMFYDWNVSPSGYVGPDCWLWNPRNLIPQQGRTSIQDMEYVTALTWVSKKYLEDILESIEGDEDEDENEENLGGWNVDALVKLIEVAGTAKTDSDQEKDTLTQRDRVPQAVRKGICLATRYEAGDDGNWCTFAPDHGYLQVRELPNPHKNGRIPFVIKYSQPLFDSFYGLGDFQRAKPLQFARDGLTNFYFKGIKMNLIPPIIANVNGVMKHTLDYREGSVMLETIPNSIRRMETSNAGLATYQGAQTSLTGSLLALYGSQNASIPGSDALNPSQGKTPSAISMYTDKEATRDGQERNELEGAIEQLTDGFNSMLVNIGTEDVPINLFEDDIQDIVDAGLTDVLDMFEPNSTGTGGVLRIDPSKLQGIEYRFNIDRGSTAKMNKEAQLKAVDETADFLGKFQNIVKDDPRVEINFPDIMKVREELSGIKGVSKFVTIKDGPSPQEVQAQQEQAKAQAAQQTPTQVASPGGQVHESADLVKLLNSDIVLRYPDLAPQILRTMGFEPGQAVQEPITTVSGHSFHDPAIAAAVDALHQPGQTPPPPPTEEPAQEPSVSSGGTVFGDPTIAKVADAVHNL